MKTNVTVALATLVAFTGCATNETAIKEAIKKNPNLIFQAIEDHPEEFMETVQRASQKAQQAQYEKAAEERKAQQESNLKNPLKPVLSEDRRLAGAPSAKIVMVEYADFQCPACKMGQDGIHEFKERHKDQVQFYYKNMPLSFHQMAMPAATYFEALALRDRDKARKFYHYVFDNQRAMTDEAFLKKAVKAVGADLAQVEKDRQSDKVRDRIKEDMAEFEKFGFTGTPVIVLNGVALHGAQRVEDLERVLKLTQN